MKSNSIFTVTHRQGDERTYRAQDGTKGTQKCLCDVGYISGNAWNMLAITLPGFTDNEAWYVINLVDQQNVFLASVAVLGATSGEHAVNMALRTFNGDFCGVATASPYDVPEAQAFVLKRLLDNEARAMFKARVNYEELSKIRKRLTLTPAVWNGAADIVSHKNVGDLVADMARNDYNSELVTQVSPVNLQSEVMKGSETDQYDSIVTQVSRLDAWSKRIITAMGEAADTVKPVNVTTTEPFKKNGVVNIAQIYELSDGQTVTIVYHNPDSTPARLDAKDILTSWKFLLNKRDVTAALQPKSGKDVNVKDLAKRILKIAEANSARFIRNQERKTGAQQALDELAKIEQEKRDLLASLIQEIAELQRQLDEPIGTFIKNKEKLTQSLEEQSANSFLAEMEKKNETEERHSSLIAELSEEIQEENIELLSSGQIQTSTKGGLTELVIKKQVLEVCLSPKFEFERCILDYVSSGIESASERIVFLTAMNTQIPHGSDAILLRDQLAIDLEDGIYIQKNKHGQDMYISPYIESDNPFWGMLEWLYENNRLVVSDIALEKTYEDDDKQTPDQDFEEEAKEELVNYPADEAGAFYQSVIEGAEINIELIQKAIDFASEDATHYLLSEATEVIKKSILDNFQKDAP